MAVHPGPESGGVMGTWPQLPAPCPQAVLPEEGFLPVRTGEHRGKLYFSVYCSNASVPWLHSAGRLGISFLNGLLGV